MEEMRIVFAGFGGQGLLFAGKVVAYAARRYRKLLGNAFR